MGFIYFREAGIIEIGDYNFLTKDCLFSYLSRASAKRIIEQHKEIFNINYGTT